MKTLNFDIGKKSVLAPLAGITDRAYRQIVKEQGVSLVFTELVSAEGLIRGCPKTWRFMEFDDCERPIGIQLFGGKPESMAEAARIAESLQPDLIDINFGCPARKVVNGMAGSAIMKDLKQLRDIVHDVVSAVNTPVSCKIRSGWDADHVVAVEAARIIEGEGASLLTLHPRTRTQGFQGHSNWSHIRDVRARVSIPVIGNGDVFQPSDARRMIDETGCDAVMIGRGAMGKPWICRHIDYFLEHKKRVPDPDISERFRICLKHHELAIRYAGTDRGIKEMRKHIGWYVRGLPGVSKFRAGVMVEKDAARVREMLLEFGAALANP